MSIFRCTVVQIVFTMSFFTCSTILLAGPYPSDVEDLIAALRNPAHRPLSIGDRPTELALADLNYDFLDFDKDHKIRKRVIDVLFAHLNSDQAQRTKNQTAVALIRLGQSGSRDVLQHANRWLGSLDPRAENHDQLFFTAPFILFYLNELHPLEPVALQKATDWMLSSRGVWSRSMHHQRTADYFGQFLDGNDPDFVHFVHVLSERLKRFPEEADFLIPEDRMGQIRERMVELISDVRNMPRLLGLSRLLLYSQSKARNYVSWLGDLGEPGQRSAQQVGEQTLHDLLYGKVDRPTFDAITELLRRCAKGQGP